MNQEPSKRTRDEDAPQYFDFLVDEDDEIEVEITVVPSKTASGSVRAVPIDVDEIQRRIDALRVSKNRLDEELHELEQKTGVLDESKRITNAQVSIALGELIAKLERALKAPRTTLKAYFKIPDWETTCRLTSESMVVNDQGEYVFSAEQNKKARVRHLLKSWTLTDKKGNPIPVSRAPNVDGSIVEAFLSKLDSYLNIDEVEAKN